MKTIHTAYYFQQINEAAKAGNDLKIYKISHSDYENFDFCIYQNMASLEIELVTDRQTALKYDADTTYRQLLDWNKYYPFIPKTPIVAYVIPKDITVGETVMLEDYINNEGPTKSSRKATWNGKEFEIIED